jgi:outer membrane protein
MDKFNLNKLHWIITIILFLNSVLLLFWNFSIERKTKVGFIRSGVVLEKFKGSQKAKETFQKESEEWNKNIKTLEDEFKKLEEEYLTNRNKLSGEEKKKKEELLGKKQQDYIRYAQAIRDKSAKRENELMEPVFKEINAFLEEYGKEHGYAIVFGTVTGGNIVYGANAIDLTDEIIKRLNEQ